MKPLVVASPWSLGARAGAAAVRPTLVTAADVDRVVIRGTGEGLPVVGEFETPKWGAVRRWELPASSSLDESESLTLVLHGTGRQEIDVELRPPEGSEGRDAIEQALGRHVEAIYEASGAGDRRRRPEGRTVSPAVSFLASYGEAQQERDARLALIVRIADAMSGAVTELADRPRATLRRVRRKVRVDRVRQLDPACMRWLVRQPGKSLEQRAGPRQLVLAVAREPFFATLENRVFVDFLRRSRREAAAYASENREYEGSERMRKVAHFSWLCARALSRESLESVPPARGHVQPNYVLLHDRRYVSVWKWYVALKRKQEEQERLWAWRNRALAEVAMLAFAAAAEQMAAEFGATRHLGSEVISHGEQQNGFFLDPRSDVFTMPVGVDAEHTCVSIVPPSRIDSWARASGATGLTGTSADFLVLCHSSTAWLGPRSVTAVWCLPSISNSEVEGLGALLRSSSWAHGKVEALVLSADNRGRLLFDLGKAIGINRSRAPRLDRHLRFADIVKDVRRWMERWFA